MKTFSNKTFRFVVIAILCTAIIIGSLVLLTSPKDNAQATSDNPATGITRPHKNTTTTSSLPTLPQPQDSPTNPYEKVEVKQIGSIEIPKISMTQNLYEGVWLTVLNVGPGHWPGTADPGGYGNTVIAGHRVTHSRPFRNIDDLVVGDHIFVTTDTGRFDYVVTSHEIVLPKDIWIVDQIPGFRITLFACNPPGSATQRYVVHGELVGPPFEVPANV